jgi:hypothetical protein
MGANFDYAIIKDSKFELTNEEIRKKAKKIFAQDAHEHGHGGYSGTLAEKRGKTVTIRRGKSFDSIEDAEDYVMDVLDTDKWDNADAVPIKNKGWLVGGWCSS